MAVSNEVKGPVKFTDPLDAVAYRRKWTYLRWVGATTAGHTLVINDADGDLVWDSEADGANFNDIHPLFQIRTGLTIATMGSGHVLAYFE